MEVYVLDLESLAPRAAEALEKLSPARRDKALRLRSRDKRLQSIGAGLLLGHFVPGEIRIAPGGKPYTPAGPSFSLTHSGALAAIALGDEGVGLDCERVRPVSPALASRTMGEAERAWLAGQGAEGFFTLWTRKEAALKYLGTGADRDLRQVCVLPGHKTVLDGRAVALHTVRYGEYILSAAGQDAAFVPNEIGIDDLLKGI